MCITKLFLSLIYKNCLCLDLNSFANLNGIFLLSKSYLLEVLAETNREIEANISKNAVVVSIGYSFLDRKDQQLRDVFERADQMMYERKKELKAMGAASRI